MAGFATWFRDQLPQATADEFDFLNSRLKSFLSVAHNEDGSLIAPPAAFNFVPVGSVLPYAGSTVPQGWLLADGTAISRVTYKALFTVLGVAYGGGDGSTTFNLPDLRQRFPLGKAVSGTGATLGASGGAIDHTHTGPSHTHTGPSHVHTGPSHTHSVPSLSVPSLTVASQAITGSTTGGTTTSDGSHSHGGATGSHNHGFGGTTSGPSTNLEAQQALSGMPNYSLDSHTHTISGTTGDSTASISSDGAHTHSIPYESISGSTAGGVTGTGVSGSGTSGAEGTENTGASGTGNTGADGTENTGVNNPAFLALNYIVLASVLG